MYLSCQAPGPDPVTSGLIWFPGQTVATSQRNKITWICVQGEQKVQKCPSQVESGVWRGCPAWVPQDQK